MEMRAMLRQIPLDLSAAWAIARKDMIIYYLRPNIIVAGILFPLFMFLAFAVGTLGSGPAQAGGLSQAAQLGALIPGLLAITVLFSASTIEPVSIPIERRMKTFDRLISAPISLQALVLGESVSGFLYSVGIALIPLAIGILFFGNVILSPVALILALCLSSLCFSSMGTLFASYPTENVGEVMSMLNVVRFPLIFLSGVFIPLNTLPAWGQVIAFLSPLTYTSDLIRFGYDGASHIGPVMDILALMMYIIAFQALGTYLYRRFND
ncbi:MAG: ABC transporter permease [Methanomicrobiales archaeon]|nr:ABC transporter permease [Methanomicrobiales archaeon]MDD1669486.1 ABC transporter permease [Methanomicrobiales archaeon]